MKTKDLHGQIDQLKPRYLPSLSCTALLEMVNSEKHGAPFSFNMLEMAPGGRVLRQDHPEQHAVYAVEGQCDLLLGEEWIRLDKGGYAFIPAYLTHEFKADPKLGAKILILKL